MIREKPWECFLAFPDETSARVVADYLRANDCLAQVAPSSPALDLAPSVAVLVPGELLHRARFLWAQADFSEGKLQYMITGRLAE